MSADSITVDSATVDSMKLALDWAMRELNARRRTIERLTHERDEAKAAFAAAVRQWNKLDAHLETVTDDNLSLRRSLAEMRAERDSLRNEVATLRAAAAPRPASPDLDPFDGGCAADR